MRKISFTGNQIRMAVAVHISHPHGMSLGKSLTDLVCLPGRGRGGGAGTPSFPSVNLFVPPNTVTVCRGTDHVLVTVRSEERRVGKECVMRGRSRWSPDH